MSRTYPLPTGCLCEAQAATYACPCSCGQQMSEDVLRDHLEALRNARKAQLRAQYDRLRLGQSALMQAWHETDNVYMGFYAEALAGQTPDWRNSDGLRGYAARTVRYASEEL